jgi:predicted protein tyrosine phosphatase
MPYLQVCSLARLPTTVKTHGASHVLTLINAGTEVNRPVSVEPDNHLFIAMSDIVDPLDGHILPAEAHVRRLIGFVRGWDRAAPMVIHCYAGVSRSTAAALITAATLDPTRDERDIACTIRKLSPTATPNLRLVAEADKVLGRNGRLLAAAESIGRGEDCFEGVSFRLDV